MNRFFFPRVIARISANDDSVTDGDIAAWDGSLDWLSSFALRTPGQDENFERLPVADPDFVYDPMYADLAGFTYAGLWSETTLTSELYRVAAVVYRRQCQLHNSIAEIGNLTSWAITILRLLPPGSQYEKALIWPMAIVAKEFTLPHDREYTISRLEMLEQRYRLKHYYIMRKYLFRFWDNRDTGMVCEAMKVSLFG